MIIIALHAIGRRRKVTNRKDYYPPILFAKLERRVYIRKFSRHGREDAGSLVAQSHVPVRKEVRYVFVGELCKMFNRKNENKNDKMEFALNNVSLA